jgi:hypothetical protein
MAYESTDWVPDLDLWSVASLKFEATAGFVWLRPSLSISLQQCFLKSTMQSGNRRRCPHRGLCILDVSPVVTQHKNWESPQAIVQSCLIHLLRLLMRKDLVYGILRIMLCSSISRVSKWTMHIVTFERDVCVYCQLQFHSSRKQGQGTHAMNGIGMRLGISCGDTVINIAILGFC